METKKIIGIVILGASVGLLVFIYKGYLKPRLDVDKKAQSGALSFSTNTTTTK